MTKIGPREQQLREQRERRAREVGQAMSKVSNSRPLWQKQLNAHKAKAKRKK